MRKTLVTAGVAAVIGVAGVAGTAAVSAEQDGTDLTDKIAQKFNLDPDEVKEVFDEHREEKHQEHQVMLEERLDKAVSAGKLTEDQKTKVLAKLEELRKSRKTSFEASKDKAPGDKREIRLQHHDDLQAWAEDNDIPMEYLRFGPMHKHGHDVRSDSGEGES